MVVRFYLKQFKDGGVEDCPKFTLGEIFPKISEVDVKISVVFPTCQEAFETITEKCTQKFDLLRIALARSAGMQNGQLPT